MNNVFMDMDLDTAKEALVLLFEDIKLVDENDITKMLVLVSDIIALIRIYLHLLKNDFPLIAENFSNFTLEDIKNFRLSGMALWALKAQHEAAAKQSTNRKDIYKEANALRAKIAQILNLKYGDDPMVIRVLEITKPGHGYADRAEDLTAFSLILDERREELVATSLITNEEIDRAAKLPELLVDRTDNIRDEKEAARILRNKAWTHFLKNYHNVRKHIEFFHYNSDKLDEYPSLFKRKKRKVKKKDITPNNEPG